MEESDFLNLLYDERREPGSAGPRPWRNGGQGAHESALHLCSTGRPELSRQNVFMPYAYRTVEDYFHCNLTDIANDTFAQLRARNEIAVSDARLR